MSNGENNQSGDTNRAARKPDLLGYTVRPIGDGRKSSWSKVAAAWAHKDGQGFELRMDALPVDGRLVLRAAQEDNSGDPDMVDPAPAGLD